jgi:exonuclease III
MFTDNVTITSFNCKNLKSSADEVKELLMNCDILLLQETWLFESESVLLGQLNKDFYYKGISAMDTEAGIITGRPYGGLGLLWRKSLSLKCSPLLYNDTRLLGIELTCCNKKLLLINAYLPYCCTDNTEEFLLYLSKIDSMIVSSDTAYVMVIGDFNADPSAVSHRFGKELSAYCAKENLVISDMVHLHDSYTYVNASVGVTSWLDHVVCTSSMHDLIDKVYVKYDTVSSDHLPLTVRLKLTAEHFSHVEDRDNYSGKKVYWSKMSKDQLDAYTLLTENNLASVKFDHSLALCDDPDCKDPIHISGINSWYQAIIESLSAASSDFAKSEKHGFSQVLGWNDFCREAHAEARSAFLAL